MKPASHTPGPWVVGPVDDTVVTHMGKDGVRYEVAAIDGDYNQPETWPVMEANARLIAAAPDLKRVASNFEIVGPDADGLVWLHLHGQGTTGKAMFNLGTTDRVAVQVALLLEGDRRSALAKATLAKPTP